MSNTLKLGQEVKDRISGVEGIVFGITDWLHGCRSISVAPLLANDDGSLRDRLSFDEPQLEVIGPGLSVTEEEEEEEEEEEPARHTGGPERHVSRDRRV